MKLLVTRQTYWYLGHIRIFKSFNKQIHAYVGLSGDDWSIILYRCSVNEGLVKLLLFPCEGGSEMTSICVVLCRITIKMVYGLVYMILCRVENQDVCACTLCCGLWLKDVMDSGS